MKDFIIDFETLGNKPNAVVVDASVIVFDPDPTKLETIEDLISRGKRFKLNIHDQKNRTVNQTTLDFWRSQSKEAKENLKPSDSDLSISDATKGILDFLKDNGVNQWKSLGYCRGQGFDFPILINMIQETYKTLETEKYEPIKYHRQRDIRTAIESLSLNRGLTKTPLRKGVLNGFVAHDSIHDCAKDILMLKMAQRYAMGLEDVPNKEDIDEKTIK